MRRIHRLLLATSLVGALTACGGDGGTDAAAGSTAGAGSGSSAGTSGSGGSGTTAGGSDSSGGTAGTAGSGSGGSSGTTGGTSGAGAGGTAGAAGSGGSGSGAGSGTTGGSGTGTTGTAGSTTGTGSTGSTGTSGTGGSTGSGATPLTLTASVPANNDGVIHTASAVQATNEARAADGAIPTSYCAVTFLIAPSSNGKSYNVTVYFRQTDAKVLHASINDGLLGLWVVVDTDVIDGIDKVAVDVAARTVRFTQKSLVGVPDPLQPVPLSPTQSTIADGSFGFPSNGSAVAACGV